MKSTLLIVSASVLALIVLSSGAWAAGKALSGSDTETHAVAQSVHTVVLDVDSGHVELVRGDDHVSVRETRHWDLRKPTVKRELHNGVLTVRADCHGGFPLSNCKTDLRVALPAGVALDVSTHVGDVTGHGLETRDAKVQTNVGDVDLGFARGQARVSAKTNVGDVTLDVPRGTYAVDTSSDVGDEDVNGLIQDEAAAQRIHADTDVGDVTLNGR
jgi:hypothetical protein